MASCTTEMEVSLIHGRSPVVTQITNQYAFVGCICLAEYGMELVDVVISSKMSIQLFYQKLLDLSSTSYHRDMQPYITRICHRPTCHDWQHRESYRSYSGCTCISTSTIIPSPSAPYLAREICFDRHCRQLTKHTCRVVLCQGSKFFLSKFSRGLQGYWRVKNDAADLQVLRNIFMRVAMLGITLIWICY